MIYTAREFATHFKIHINTVMRLLRANRISGAFRIGKSWRIEMKSDLDSGSPQFMTEQAQQEE